MYNIFITKPRPLSTPQPQHVLTNPDIDECVSNPCSPGAVCVNTPGSHNCSCPTGFSALTSNGECLDINECSKNNSCATNAKCINVPGSFKCICPKGFEGEGDLFCNS